MNFKDRRIWITGASSGIGEALAVAFHQAGAKLIFSARREDELKRVQAACGGAPKSRILPMDVTNATELPEKTQLALGMFGGIDILVLNAVITQRSLTRETEEKVYRQLMEVNFFASEAIARAVLPSMLAQKSGHMVVISSVAGKFGVPLRSGYSAQSLPCMAFLKCFEPKKRRTAFASPWFAPAISARTSACPHCGATA